MIELRRLLGVFALLAAMLVGASYAVPKPEYPDILVSAPDRQAMPDLPMLSASSSPTMDEPLQKPEPTIAISPDDIIQGDPILISIHGLTGSTTVAVKFGATALQTFSYKGDTDALYGFDIHKDAGVYGVTATLSDGTVLKKDVLVGERTLPEVAFDIPAKLGGDTISSESTLVSTLAAENASLLGLKTGTKPFWTLSFAFPVTDPVMTDPYGYNRQTDATTITHKGTDFHAPPGTPVMAINRGVVRLVQETRNYGKTIVVDHGLGLMSFYMHLSRIDVTEGQLVQQGQVIGLSGETGYAEGPHLHLTVRINEVSIDPMVFFGLLGPQS